MRPSPSPRQRHLWSAPGTNAPILPFPRPQIQARPATPSMERAGNRHPNPPFPPAADSGASGNAIYGARRAPTPQFFHWPIQLLPNQPEQEISFIFFFLILDFPVHFKLTSFSNLKFKANSKLELRPSGTVPISSASINLIAVQSTRCLIFAVQSITMAVNGLELDETSLRLASRS